MALADPAVHVMRGILSKNMGGGEFLWRDPENTWLNQTPEKKEIKNRTLANQSVRHPGWKDSNS
jgi:hypothetical protein